MQGFLGKIGSRFGAGRFCRRWRRLLPAAGLLLAGLAMAAESPYRIELLLSEGNGPYQALAEALDTELAALGREDLQLRQSLVEAHDHDALASADLVVSVGSRASRLLHQLPARGQVLHVLIPSTSHPLPTPQEGSGARHSAIYLDQPWSRQLNLIRLALPGVERVGILLGSTSRDLRDELEQAIAARQWQAQFALVPEDGNYLGPLRRLLEQSEVLLAVPDQQVFNRQNLQGILLTTYRREVPMIGFSPGYVRAGALAAVYTTPEQVATQAARWIAPLVADRGRLLPPPQAPDLYSVAVNHQVARSLGLRIPGEEELRMGLQTLEDQP